MGTFTSQTIDSGAVVIRPTGQINLVSAPTLRRDLHDLVTAGGNLWVVDLSGVDFIDSSGLGALISGLKAAREAGGDLRIAAPNAQVMKVLELTNLTRVLSPYESVDAAAADRP